MRNHVLTRKMGETLLKVSELLCNQSAAQIDSGVFQKAKG